MRHAGFDDPTAPYDPDKYANIAEAAMDPMTPPTICSQAELDYKLNCLPPIYVSGGFLVGEPTTDCAIGTVYSMYSKANGVCYAKYVVHGRPETYIDRHRLDSAFPLDPHCAAWLEEEANG